MAGKSVKRQDCELDDDNSDDEWVGPLPSEASKPKKRKCQFIYRTEVAHE